VIGWLPPQVLTIAIVLGSLSLARWAMTLAVALLAATGNGRAKVAIIALLRARDIDWCTNWLVPLFLVKLADKPSGRQMISSYIGKAATNGHYWAQAAAEVIDGVAEALGDRPGHCERAYRHYKGLDG
jgi:hypothetical protein